MSFDPVVVGNYLNEIITGDSEFIDKVINMPVSMPAIEQENIDNFLFDEINELFDFLEIPGEKKDAFEKNFHQDVYHSFIKKLIKTLRQAKRYINGIYATLPSMVNEVNLFDFFLLESIRIFNPELYRDIWKNYNDYIYNPKILMMEDPDRIVMEDKEYEKPVKERITKLLGTETQTQKIFRELICILFPDTIGKIFKELKQLKDVYRSGEDERLEKRLSHTECFPKYFIHKIPLHEEPDAELERLILTLKSGKPKDQKIRLGKKLSEIGEKRCPYDFLKLLLDFSGEIDPNLTRSIVEVIYEKADLISDDNVRNLSLLELKLIDDNLDSNSIKEVIEKLVLNTLNFYFATDIVLLTRHVKNSKWVNISKSIDNDLLKIQLSDRLKKHFIDGQRDIFETVHDSGLRVVLYKWGSDWGTNSGKSSQIVSDYVFSLIEVDIKKFSKFLKFVGYLVGQKKPSDFIFNFEKFKKIFNWQAFVKIVCNFKDNPELTNEEISLIQGVLKQASKEAEEAEKTRVVRKKAKS